MFKYKYQFCLKNVGYIKVISGFFSRIEDAKSAVKEYCQIKSNQKMQMIMEIEKMHKCS